MGKVKRVSKDREQGKEEESDAHLKNKKSKLIDDENVESSGSDSDSGSDSSSGGSDSESGSGSGSGSEDSEVEEEKTESVTSKVSVHPERLQSGIQMHEERQNRDSPHKRKSKSVLDSATPSNVEHELEELSNKGRPYTVSIALPGSIVANAQSAELKTYLVGQIARAAAIFNVDEIVVFSETGETSHLEGQFEGANRRGSDPNSFLARVLQYLETPQYLRKHFFPVHKDLKYAGLLNPIDAPHHYRASHDAHYREGVVVNRPSKDGQGSWVNIGLRQDCTIDHKLAPGMRVTVEIENPKGSATRRKIKGKAVSPAAPRERHGMYWGYQVRMASSLSKVWTECPFEGGYDVSVGTSERGQDCSSSGFSLSPFKHLLVVFGGIGGIEDCLIGDDHLHVSNPDELFDVYVNSCPNQGSRTIRTEEAIPITLAALGSHIRNNQAP